MAIRVKHGPDLNLVGGAAFTGGVGDYMRWATQQKLSRDKFTAQNEFNWASLAQRDASQRRQMDFQAQQAFQQRQMQAERDTFQFMAQQIQTEDAAYFKANATTEQYAQQQRLASQQNDAYLNRLKSQAGIREDQVQQAQDVKRSDQLGEWMGGLDISRLTPSAQGNYSALSDAVETVRTQFQNGAWDQADVDQARAKILTQFRDMDFSAHPPNTMSGDTWTKGIEVWSRDQNGKKVWEGFSPDATPEEMQKYVDDHTFTAGGRGHFLGPKGVESWDIKEPGLPKPTDYDKARNKAFEEDLKRQKEEWDAKSKRIDDANDETEGYRRSPPFSPGPAAYKRANAYASRHVDQLRGFGSAGGVSGYGNQPGGQNGNGQGAATSLYEQNRDLVDSQIADMLSSGSPAELLDTLKMMKDNPEGYGKFGEWSAETARLVEEAADIIRAAQRGN